MKRTWTLRYKFHGGKTLIPQNSGIGSHHNIMAAACKAWPSLEPDDNYFHWGDMGRIFLLPKPEDECLIFDDLPDLRHRYQKSTNDCENAVSRRLIQIDDFLLDWTDIPEGIVFSYMEIRGFVRKRGELVPHSMLMGQDIDGDISVREPYNGLVGRRLPHYYMIDPYDVIQR